MGDEELLPKPQTDLPLPEKELPEHATEPVIVKNEIPGHQGKSPVIKFFLFGTIVAIILTAIGGAYVFGKNSVYKELNPTAPAIPPADPDVYEPTLTPDLTADWKTYNWLEQNKSLFSVKYPSTWNLFEYEKLQTVFFPQGYERSKIDGKVAYLAVGITNLNPEDCRGGCPLIEKATDVKVAGYNARKLEGYFGAIGGNIPRRFEEIVIPRNGSYIVLTLNGKNMEEISSEDIKTFNQMLETLKFTD